MAEPTHLSKLVIQEPQNRSEVNDTRDRQIISEAIHLAANVEVATDVILIAQRPLRVGAVREIHGTAGTDPGAVTIDVTKATGTQAPAAGTTILATAASINLKAVANTVQAPALAASAVPGGILDLAVGDRIAMVVGGVTTAVAGVCLQIDLIPI